MTNQEKIARFVSEIGRCFHAPAPTPNRKASLMTEFDNTNKGVLFNERDKKRDDKDRDYAGSINIEGREFWLSAWIRESKKGTKFMSLSVKAKEETAARSSGSRSDDFGDEIPF
jgi:hypothetical protein